EDTALVRRTTAEPRTLGGRRHLVLLDLRSRASRRAPPALQGSGQVVLGVVRVVVGRRAVEVHGAVLEPEAQALQLLLDLGDRLGTEVADVQQVGLAARG